MTEEILFYFELYRKKIQELEEIRIIDQKLRDDIIDAQQKNYSLSIEIDQMQRLITYMIDNDIDPVEAKLKTDDIDRQKNYWYKARDSQTASGIGVSGSLLPSAAPPSLGTINTVTTTVGPTWTQLLADTNGVAGPGLTHVYTTAGQLPIISITKKI